jgi:hypothetical protein
MAGLPTVRTTHRGPEQFELCARETWQGFAPKDEISFRSPQFAINRCRCSDCTVARQLPPEIRASGVFTEVPSVYAGDRLEWSVGDFVHRVVHEWRILVSLSLAQFRSYHVNRLNFPPTHSIYVRHWKPFHQLHPLP